MRWKLITTVLLVAAVMPFVLTHLGFVLLTIENRTDANLSIEYRIGRGHTQQTQIEAGELVLRPFFVGTDEGSLEIRARGSTWSVSEGYFSTHNGGLELLTFHRRDAVEFKEYFCAGCR